VHLGNLLTAAALNLVRIVEWLDGTTWPTTRVCAFRKLMCKNHAAVCASVMISPAVSIFRQQYLFRGNVKRQVVL